MSEDEEIVKDSKDYLLTETDIHPKQNAEEVLARLRRRKTTGQLVFHLSQGGIQRVVLAEKTKAAPRQSEKMREALGME